MKTKYIVELAAGVWVSKSKSYNIYDRTTVLVNAKRFATRKAAEKALISPRYVGGFPFKNPKIIEVGLSMDIVYILQRQQNFSLRAFGENPRLLGIIDHIKKEVVEVEQNPNDAEEWIDIAILALDGAMRSGQSPFNVANALIEKIKKNELRKWPDHRLMSSDRAIEHIKEEV